MCIRDRENIFCEGQSAVLSVPNVQGGTRYQWFNDGVFFISGTSNSLLIPSISSSESGEWTVIAEQGICASDTSVVFPVTVESSLSIGATNNGPICEGDSVRLTSSFIPDASYRWLSPSGMVHEGRIVTVLGEAGVYTCLLYTSPSPRDATLSRMPSSA